MLMQGNNSRGSNNVGNSEMNPKKKPKKSGKAVKERRSVVVRGLFDNQLASIDVQVKYTHTNTYILDWVHESFV